MLYGRRFRMDLLNMFENGTNLFVVPSLARFYDDAVAALAEQRQRLVAELAALLRIDRHLVVQLLKRSMT